MMKIVINKISNTLRFGVALIVLTTAQSGVADNIIHEGESIPGGFYLGMGRDEVNRIDFNHYNSKNCRTRNKCFMGSPADNDVYVNLFLVNDIVIQIETAKRGFENTPDLETTAGVTSYMSPDEVAAIYPSAVKKIINNSKTDVLVADRGYTYSSYLRCPPYSFLGPCTYKGIHRIYQPAKGPIDDIDQELVLSNLSGARGSNKIYTLIAPNGTGSTKIIIYGGKGDADLYVKKGSVPTLNSYDCRPYRNGNYETCEFYTPGTYYIMVRGYTSYSGLSLKGLSE